MDWSTASRPVMISSSAAMTSEASRLACHITPLPCIRHDLPRIRLRYPKLALDERLRLLWAERLLCGVACFVLLVDLCLLLVDHNGRLTDIAKESWNVHCVHRAMREAIVLCHASVESHRIVRLAQ